MTLQIIVTNAGRAALVNASHDGTLPVTIASVGISATAVVPVATATALPGEIKRIATIGGTVVAADTMHVLVRDESTSAYNMKSFALYLADGTLFAIYGQAADIVSKVAPSTMLLAIDVQFADITASSIAFGDTNFVDPPASESRPGVLEIANDAEALAMADALRAATPRHLGLIFTAAKILQKLVTIDGSGSGLDADLLDGLDSSAFAKLVGAFFTGAVTAPLLASGGNLIIGQASSGAAYILRPDADGYRSISFACQGGTALDQIYFASQVLLRSGSKIWDAGNDGAGSGLDADLLDGQDSSYFTNIVARLGFTPVQQGTGIGQLSNTIKIGWTSAGRLKATVDATDLGQLTTDAILALGALPINGGTMARTGYHLWGPDNDGAGSALDADLLDGQHGSYYADIPGRLGFMPVQQGTGIGQLGNAVKIGWSAGSRLKATVDNVDQGPLATEWLLAGQAYDVNGAQIRRGTNHLWGPDNDGSGSGLDADLLDGQHGSFYADVVGRLGYTPTSRDSTHLGLSGNEALWTPTSNQDWADLPSGASRFVTQGAWGTPSNQFGYFIKTARRDGSGGWGGLWVNLDGGGCYAGQASVGTSAPSWDLLWSRNTDGSGSGLDADLLDGKQASDFAQIWADATLRDVTAGRDANTGVVYFGWAKSRYLYFDGGAYQLSGGPLVIGGQTAFHTGNDGSGSGLDADLLDGHDSGYFLPAGWYTAGDVIAKLLGVDGSGSGLDADLLDGHDSGYFLPAGNYNSWDVRAKLLDVDGSGSGIDADLLDGRQASDFASAGDFQFGSNENGYWERRPNGMIEQWGRLPAVNGAGGYSFYFPIPFSDANSVNVQLTGINLGNASSLDCWPQAGDHTTDACNWTLQWTNQPTTSPYLDGVYWRAVGR